MGGIIGGGKGPKPPKIKPPPPPANPPTIANPAVSGAGAQARARAGQTMAGTIQTSPQGLTAPPVAQASLLGGAS